MQYYSYLEETKEYAGTGTAQPDPLESSKQGESVWLLPANAVFTAPLEAKEGYAVVWNDTMWEYAEDHRGTEYWLPGDTWQTPAREMKELGALPDGALLERPVKTPGEIEKERLEQAKSERAQAVQDIAVTVDGMVFDGNEDAQRRISVAIATANISGQTEVEWVLKDNTVVLVSREQLEKVLVLSMQKMQDLWTKPYKDDNE